MLVKSNGFSQPGRVTTYLFSLYLVLSKRGTSLPRSWCFPVQKQTSEHTLALKMVRKDGSSCFSLETTLNQSHSHTLHQEHFNLIQKAPKAKACAPRCSAMSIGLTLRRCRACWIGVLLPSTTNTCILQAYTSPLLSLSGWASDRFSMVSCIC